MLYDNVNEAVCMSRRSYKTMNQNVPFSNNITSPFHDLSSKINFRPLALIVIQPCIVELVTPLPGFGCSVILHTIHTIVFRKDG